MRDWDGHTRTEYANYRHGHNEYVAHDELEDRLRDVTRDIEDDADREFARKDHGHEKYDDQGAELDDLRDQVGELIRDRDAMIRRMRLLEAALSLTPPAEMLTSHDEPPFTPAAPQ